MSWIQGLQSSIKALRARKSRQLLGFQGCGLREKEREEEIKRDLVSLSSMRCTEVFLSFSTDLSVISKRNDLISCRGYMFGYLRIEISRVKWRAGFETTNSNLVNIRSTRPVGPSLFGTVAFAFYFNLSRLYLYLKHLTRCFYSWDFFSFFFK